MGQIVVAIPTIPEREDAWEDVAGLWRTRTCQPIEVVPAWRQGSWAAGLNEVWEKHPDPEVFVCSSDDMFPDDDFWLPPALWHFERGECPVPTVLDPRMTTHGGRAVDRHHPPLTEAQPAQMTNFPILSGAWLNKVFPLPEGMHYYSDNLIGDKLTKAGIPLVTCRDIKIRHTWDSRGRGCGMGDEPTRMSYDRTLYEALR